MSAHTNLVTIDVRDLVGKDVSGTLANVRTPKGVYADDNTPAWDRPLIRKLKTVTRKQETRNGVKQSWVYWDWEPEHHDPALCNYGGRDCGYSGHLDEGEPILIQIEAKP